MRLVSDHDHRRQSLQRTLSLWGACSAFGPSEVGAAVDLARLLVVDLDLSQRGTIEMARAMLAPYRLAGAPCLFLLRDMSPRSQTQAHALGAREILSIDAPRSVLLDKVGAMLGTGGSAAAGAGLQHRFITASAAFGDLLDAAASGGHLPSAAINESVEALNRAAEGGDLDAWLDLVWQHDDATYQHCLLVSGLAAAFAHRLGFGEADRRLITGAAVLHDIGKARTPLDILRKAGELTAEERGIMQEHPRIGHDMLLAQGGFAPTVLAAVLSHHEYLDGSGYPHGLSAGQIPDPVRMITICDIYAALIERRSYKPPMLPEQAYAILAGMAGKLDLDLVRVFGEVIVAASATRLGRQIETRVMPTGRSRTAG